MSAPGGPGCRCDRLAAAPARRRVYFVTCASNGKMVGVYEIRCWCGTTFTAGRSTARYCSGRCRVAEHRRLARSHIEDERLAAGNRWCAECGGNTDGSGGVIEWWERPDKLFCSKACKQKYYRDSGGPPIPDEVFAGFDALAAELLEHRSTPDVSTPCKDTTP